MGNTGLTHHPGCLKWRLVSEDLGNTGEQFSFSTFMLRITQILQNEKKQEKKENPPSFYTGQNSLAPFFFFSCRGWGWSALNRLRSRLQWQSHSVHLCVKACLLSLYSPPAKNCFNDFILNFKQRQKKHICDMWGLHEIQVSSLQISVEHSHA